MLPQILYRLVSIRYNATSKNIPEHSIPTCTLSAEIAKCMTHLTLIPLKLTAYRITNRPCCYLFGHILGIYQRNDYGKTIWVRKTYHGHQNMANYPINLEWVCNTFSNTFIFYPIFRWTVHFSFCSLPCARVHLWWGVQRNPRREGQSNDQVRKKSQLKYPITTPTKILKRLLKVVVSPEHKVLVSSIDGCWSLGYFRVAPSFCFKARLSAKLLVWLIFGSGLLRKISRFHLKWPWA